MESKPLPSTYAADLSRLCTIPLAPEMTEEDVKRYSDWMVKPEHQQEWSLLRSQATAIRDYYEFQQAYMSVSVGGGKTGISILLPQVALMSGRAKKVLILIPSALQEQFKVDFKMWKKRCHITYDLFTLAGEGPRRRKMMALTNRAGVYLLTYHQLQAKDGEEILNTLDPDIVVADEAHMLASDSARASRFMRYMESRMQENRPVLLCPMSGTLIKKTLEDLRKITDHSLHDNTFLPKDDFLFREFAEIIDAAATADDANTEGYSPKSFVQLMNWHQLHFAEDHAKLPPGVPGFRKVFSKRMSTTPGVQVSGETDFGSSLEIHNTESTIPNDEHGRWLETLIENLELYAESPNGEPLAHHFLSWSWHFQLNAGFYVERLFPEPQEVVDVRGVDVPTANAWISRGKEWLESHKRYSSVLRQFLENTEIRGCDTPALAAISMQHHQDQVVGSTMYQLWCDEQSLAFDDAKQLALYGSKDRFGRKEKVVRVCDYKIQDMLLWVKSLKLKKNHPGVVIWVYHDALLAWASEWLRYSGYNVVACDRGDESNVFLAKGDFRGTVCVASIAAHGIGKNLQNFQHQFCLQMIRPAHTIEQLLGRVHRRGQKMDRVVFNTNISTEWDRRSFAASLNDSLFQQQTGGSPMRLITAAYNPMPEIVPYEVLRERGDNQVMRLSADQYGLLCDKFGN